MSFSTNMSGAPIISTYEEALVHYNSIKPVRGHGDLRPIMPNQRRAHHKRIVLERDTSVSLRLHNTDLITYHPPLVGHDVVTRRVTLNGWPSMSSSAFMHPFLPKGVQVRLHMGRMFIGIVTDVGDTYWVCPSRAFTIETKDNGISWRIEAESDTFASFSRKLLDKDKAKEVRKNIAPFLAWVKAVSALNNEDVTELCESHISWDKETFSKADAHIKQLINVEIGVEDYPKILPKIVRTRSLKGSFVIKNYEEVIRDFAYEAADAFITVDEPAGTLPRYSRW